jgi:hypothetical protein
MGFLWRKRAKPETEPEPQDRSEETPAAGEAGEPDPSRATVGKDPVTGKWVSLKRM